MNWGFLENVLSGVNKYSTVVGRVWLSVLFVFRILVFVAAAEQVWKDEFKDFVCNTQQPGCEQVCFDSFFPISQVRLWALQLIMVSTPSLLVALHVAYREHREQKHRRRLYRDKGSIDGGLLLTYIASLLLKTACEVATLMAFHLLYSGFRVPRLLRCDQSPCPNTVDCYIARSTEKTLFLYIMAATSGLCIALNLLEMAYIFCKQCWKCFGRRYVPVRGGALPSSKLSLGSPPPDSGVEGQPPSLSYGVKAQPPLGSGVDGQPLPGSEVKGQPLPGSGVKGQPLHSSWDKGQVGTESLA